MENQNDVPLGNANEQLNTSVTDTTSPELQNEYTNDIQQEQNLPLAIIGGLLASIIGAVIWATITVLTKYQIGYMAIAVGFIVGFAIRLLGKGSTPVFGVIGALCAIIGCLMGNYLSIVGFAAEAQGLGYFETLTLISPGAIPEIMIEAFQPMDLFFYALAVYEGFKFSLLR